MDLYKNIDSDEDANILIEKLKVKIAYYEKLNQQNERIFSKLKISPEDLSPTAQRILDDLTLLQVETKLRSLDVDDVCEAVLDMTEKTLRMKNEIESLKVYEVDLINSTDEVKKEVLKYEEELELASSQIKSLDGSLDTEFNSIKMVLKFYEDNIKNFVENNQWIHEPEFNMLSIKEEIKKLHLLQNEVDQLEKEKSVYQGLAPDIYQAKMQLKNIISEYESLCKKLHGSLQ